MDAQVVPQNVVQLECSELSTFSRGEKESLAALEYVLLCKLNISRSGTPDICNTPNFLEHQTQLYKEHSDKIGSLYSSQYNILTIVDQKNSKWMAASKVEKAIEYTTSRRQMYNDLKRKGT